MGLQGEKERGPVATWQGLAILAEQIEPFWFGKPLASSPEMGEPTADEVDSLCVMHRVLAVEIRLPAMDDTEKEFLRIISLEVVLLHMAR